MNKIKFIYKNKVNFMRKILPIFILFILMTSCISTKITEYQKCKTVYIYNSCGQLIKTANLKYNEDFDINNQIKFNGFYIIKINDNENTPYWTKEVKIEF